IKELKTQIQQLQDESTQATKVFEEQAIAFDDWESTLLQQETELNAEFTSLQQEETHLKVQAKLSEFADNLADGQPCPLCGALEHPYPMINHNVTIKIQEILGKQTAIKQRLQQLKANHQILTAASIRQREKNAQLAQQKSNLQKMEEKLSTHRMQFRWEEFSPTDKTAFLSYKDKNHLAETHIKLADASLKEFRVQLQTAQSKIEKYKSSLAEFEQRIVVLDQLNKHNTQQINVLKI